jgi:hypothetical protein
MYIPTEILRRQKIPYCASFNINELIPNNYSKYILSEYTVKRFNIYKYVCTVKYINSIIKRQNDQRKT